MPTPSSSRPPNPPASSSLNSSTCPEDAQVLGRSGPWHRNERQEVGHDAETRDAIESNPLLSPPVDAIRPDSPSTESLTERQSSVEQSSSTEPLSGSATMSPAPLGNVDGTDPTSVSATEDPTKNTSTAADRCPQHTLLASFRQRNSQPDSALAAKPRREKEIERVYSRHSEVPDPSPSTFMGPGFGSKRAIPLSPSSFLRSGSKFIGSQSSETQTYDVQVEIKHVDMRESFICGYLRIQGLTADHPTLTTYFDGEIIGDQYSFLTKHDEWGANAKVDFNHWSKFTAFRPFQKQARKGPVHISEAAQREFIFMRWKEHFLVPNHRVRTISGASFEGFYYICFNQVQGEVEGIYFHSKSEKFQRLRLTHVPDRGCFSAMEFR